MRASHSLGVANLWSDHTEKHASQISTAFCLCAERERDGEETSAFHINAELCVENIISDWEDSE